MPIPPSGPISMSMINVELAYPATQIISLNDAAVRALAQVPAGMISLSNFYGKSNITPAGYSFGGNTNFPGTTYSNAIYEFPFNTETASLIGTTTPGTSLGISIGNLPTNNVSLRLQTPTNLTIGWERFSFSSKTFSNQATLPSPIINFASPSRMQDNVQNKSFALAGNSTAPATIYQTQHNLDNSTYAITSVVSGLTPAPSNLAYGQVSWTAAKNFSKGLIGGGTAPPGPAPINPGKVFRTTFPTNTTTYLNIQTPLSEYGTVPGTNFNNATAGFVMTGAGPSPTGAPTNMGRMDFSTETFNRYFQNIGTLVIGAGSWQTPNNAYTFGGYTSIPTLVGTFRKYVFGTSTYSVLGTSFPARMYPTTGYSQQAFAQSAPVFG